MREPYGYKEFKVRDIMEVSRGNDIKKAELDKIQGGSVRYIKARTTDNGIDCMIDIEPDGDLAVTVSDVGSMGVAFIQTEPFYVSGNNTYAVMKEVEDTENKLLYMSTLINKAFKHLEGVYGRLGLNKLRDTEVEIPITEDGTPDYDYIEDYISYIKGEYIEQLEESYREEYRQLEALGLDEGEIALEEPYGYEEVELGGLFRVESSERHITATGLTIKESKEEGTDKYVVRKEGDNGVRGYISSELEGINKGKVISFAQDTFVFYYQEEDFFTGNNVKILRHKEFEDTGKEIGLYLASAYNKYVENKGWGEGSSVKRIKKYKATLPITEEGTPDYDYMENYIKHIAYKYRINRREYQEEEIRLLREMV